MVKNLLEVDYPDEGIESAVRFEVCECPSCPNAHIVLYNEANEPFAQMTLGPSQLRTLIGGCEEVFGEKKPESKN